MTYATPPNEALHLTVTILACARLAPAGERQRYTFRVPKLANILGEEYG